MVAGYHDRAGSGCRIARVTTREPLPGKTYHKLLRDEGQRTRKAVFVRTGLLTWERIGEEPLNWTLGWRN